jgi:hypothetical protein
VDLSADRTGPPEFSQEAAELAEQIAEIFTGGNGANGGLFFSVSFVLSGKIPMLQFLCFTGAERSRSKAVAVTIGAIRG